MKVDMFYLQIPPILLIPFSFPESCMVLSPCCFLPQETVLTAVSTGLSTRPEDARTLSELVKYIEKDKMLD